MNEQKCRICGCTEDNCSQCIKLTGHPCHWVEEDLCSSCQDALTNQQKTTDMNFFQQLAAIGDVDMTIRIMKKNDKLTLNIMPGSNVSKNQPIIITGTPEELDAEFFRTIAPEVKEITGIISNLEEVKKEVSKKKAEKSKSTPDKKQEKKTDKKSQPKNKSVAKPAAKKKEEHSVAREGSLFDQSEVVTGETTEA